MPTPAYTEFDSNKPDGSTSHTTYATDDLNNVRGLRDMAMGMLAKGFVQSRTTGTGPDAMRPQFVTWLNATLLVGFRWKLTWGGTGNWQVTSVEMEWSNDNGGTWTSVRTAQANTLDGSGNITASTQSGGGWTMFLELWGKVVKVVSDFAAHIAATGTAVHGLGDVSTQTSSAVNFTGGTAKGVTLGGTGAGEAKLATVAAVRETFNDYGTIVTGNTCTVELDKYGASRIQAPASGSFTVAFSGVPASGFVEGHVIEAVNWGVITPTLPANKRWSGGVQPTFTASGVDIIRVYTRDNGANYRFALMDKDSK